MNPADPAGAAVLDAARAIARGRSRADAAPRRPTHRPSSAPAASSASSRTARPRRPPAARCRRSSITGTRPGSAPAPSAARQSYALRADNDGELDPRRRRRRHGRAGPPATVALADRHPGRLRGRRPDQQRSRAARGRGRRAAGAGGRRHPPRHPRHDHAQRLRPRSVQRRPRGGPDGRCRQRQPADTAPPSSQRGGALVPFPLPALHGALCDRLRLDGAQGPGQRAGYTPRCSCPTPTCRCCRASSFTRRSRASGARSPSSAGASCSSGRSRARSNARPAWPNGSPPSRPRPFAGAVTRVRPPDYAPVTARTGRPSNVGTCAPSGAALCLQLSRTASVFERGSDGGVTWVASSNPSSPSNTRSGSS